MFEDQLACADLVMLNKTDLLDAMTRAPRSRARRARTACAPAVKMVRARKARVDPEVLLGLAAAAEDDLASRPSHHDAEGAHDHDDFESFVVDAAGPSPIRPALRCDGSARSSRAHDVLRVKGFVDVAGKPMRLLVQGVGDRGCSIISTAPGTPARRARSRLVVIGQKGLDRAAIAAALLG